MTTEPDKHGATQATRDAQLAAVLASAGVLLGFGLYWIVQIQAVREMLALAYG